MVGHAHEFDSEHALAVSHVEVGDHLAVERAELGVGQLELVDLRQHVEHVGLTVHGEQQTVFGFGLEDVVGHFGNDHLARLQVQHGPQLQVRVVLWRQAQRGREDLVVLKEGLGVVVGDVLHGDFVGIGRLVVLPVQREFQKCFGC